MARFNLHRLSCTVVTAAATVMVPLLAQGQATQPARSLTARITVSRVVTGEPAVILTRQSVHFDRQREKDVAVKVSSDKSHFTISLDAGDEPNTHVMRIGAVTNDGKGAPEQVASTLQVAEARPVSTVVGTLRIDAIVEPE